MRALSTPPSPDRPADRAARRRPRDLGQPGGAQAAEHRRRDPGSRRRTHPPAAGRLAVAECSSTTRWRSSTAVRPGPTAADLERRLREGAASCARAGLTEIQDASGYDADAIARAARLAVARQSCPSGSTRRSRPSRRRSERFLAKGPHVGGGDDFLTVRAIKAYADGALGSRGAALLADYSDEPGKRGLLVTPPERLAEIARIARRAGWQLWIHAIGDRGNRVALDAFESGARVASGGARGRGAAAHRARAGHRSRRLPSVRPATASSRRSSPTHATSDMPWAEDRLGPSRIAGRLRLAPAQDRGGASGRRKRRAGRIGEPVARVLRSGDAPGRGAEIRREAGGRARGSLAPRPSRCSRRTRPTRPSRRPGAGRVEAGFAADLTISRARSDGRARGGDSVAPSGYATIVGGRVAFGPLGAVSDRAPRPALSFSASGSPRRLRPAAGGTAEGADRPSDPDDARARAHGRDADRRRAACAIRACSPRCARCRATSSWTPPSAPAPTRTIRFPIAGSQTISQPYIVALMTELLDAAREGARARDRDRVRAIRARSSASSRPRSTRSRSCPSSGPLGRARSSSSSATPTSSCARATATAGWPEQAPFDGIIVTAAPERIPEPLLEQLASRRAGW